MLAGDEIVLAVEEAVLAGDENVLAGVETEIAGDESVLAIILSMRECIPNAAAVLIGGLIGQRVGLMGTSIPLIKLPF